MRALLESSTQLGRAVAGTQRFCDSFVILKAREQCECRAIIQLYPRLVSATAWPLAESQGLEISLLSRHALLPPPQRQSA